MRSIGPTAVVLLIGATIAWSQAFNTRIPNSHLAQMPPKTVKCNDSASAANVSDCTGLPNDLLGTAPQQTVKCNDTTSTNTPTDCSHIAFFLHKNNVDQTGMTTGAYQRVTFSTAKFNSGGGTFSSNTWTAPVAGFVQLSFYIYWSLHAASSSNPIMTGKIIKNSSTTCNGSDVFAGQGTPIVGFAGTAESNASGVDQAASGDVYELCAFGTSDDAMNDLKIDGNPAHTFFSGAFIR